MPTSLWPNSVAAIFFDAGNTLVEPTTPIAKVYAEFALQLAEVNTQQLLDQIELAWPTLDADYRSRHPDLISSDELEREAWSRFTRAIATPFPGLLERHREWHALLVEYFDASGAWRLTPGALQALDALSARGLCLGVISNWHSALDRVIDGLGVLDRFDLVLTSAAAGRKKPHRGIFETALGRLGVAAERAVHVGDSWTDDVEGARAAGLHAIHVCRPGHAPPNQDGVRSIQSLWELAS